MEIPWPLNSTFRISSQYGDEIWTVAYEPDPQNRITGENSPLGESLLLSGKNRICSCMTPDNTPYKIKIIGIKTPENDENIFSSPVEYYLSRYRSDLSGIRNNSFMANICLNCGHQNTPTLPGDKVCEECNTEWYRYHCWNCQRPIDSRDPGTPRCRRCHFLVCANCKSCFCQVNFPLGQY
jgi:hypothetical protein